MKKVICSSCLKDIKDCDCEVTCAKEVGVMAEEREELIEKIAKIMCKWQFMRYPQFETSEKLWRKLDGDSYKDFLLEKAKQIASLFPQYVPIEVEMLSDEEIEEARGKARHSLGTLGRKPIITIQFEEVAQAQLNKLTGGKKLYEEVEKYGN